VFLLGGEVIVIGVLFLVAGPGMYLIVGGSYCDKRDCVNQCMDVAGVPWAIVHQPTTRGRQERVS
jgi:hypothetical protein